MPWPDAGYVVHERLVPDALIDDYRHAWCLETPSLHGWPDATSYRRVPEMRDLACCAQLVGAVEELVGEPVGFHLALTGWVSTERTWHSDSYLNPDYVGDAYCGVWIALGDIHPDAGPLEVIPGSTDWPGLSQDEVLARLEPEERTDGNWPKLAERFVTDYWEKQIAERGAEPTPFLGARGDCLLWHPRLVHRGSPPARMMCRPALIVHFSALRARTDMAGRWKPWGAAQFFAECA